MKRRVSIVLIILAALLAACELPGPVFPTAAPTVEPTAAPSETDTPRPTGTSAPTRTPEPSATTGPSQTPTATETAGPSPTPTATATATKTPTPTDTPTITPTPTETPPPTPTQIMPDIIIPEDTPNLLRNPGFEGEYATTEYWSDAEGMYIKHLTASGWIPYYCDQPYTPEKCPALRQGDGNPEGLLMGRPEFKLTEIANRVHGGERAQQWFCAMRACRAGVYTTVETVPGQVCEVSVWVQTWSADGAGYPYISDVSTQDARDNSIWLIRVSPTGDTWAFADENLVSRAFGYEDGHYDQFVEISYRFVAQSITTGVFIENLRLWPIGNNDSYVDDARVRCIDVNYETPVEVIEEWEIEAQSLPADIPVSTEEELKEEGTMQISDFSIEQIVMIVVTLLALVPLLGGGVGATVSSIVNFVKVVALRAKHPLPDNWGGYLTTILNAAFFVGLLIWLGVSPAEVPLPAEIDALFTSTAKIISLLAEVVTGAAFLFGEFKGAEWWHQVVRKPLLGLVSTSYRLAQESVSKQQAARGLANQPVG